MHMETLFTDIEQIGPTIIDNIVQDEQNGRLSEAVVTALRKAGLYRLFLPASLGGLEADPVTAAKLVEHVARYNSAAAWSVMVANASNWWSKFFPAETVEEVYGRSPDTFNAGTFAAPMMATKVSGGYSVTGRVPLCSHVHEADWVCILSVVLQNGQSLMNNGMPEMRGVLMKSTECTIAGTWQALGMKATDSNDVAAENVFVPDYRTFRLSPHAEVNSYFQGALYRFPVAGINGCSLIVPVALGIAASAIDELKQLTGKVPSGSVTTLKEKGSFQRIVGKAEALVRGARAYLHQTMSDCWDKVHAGEPTTLTDKAELLLAASHANKSCVEAVDLVYSASGTTGVYTRNKISRYFTDIQVVRQHGFANENRFETAAQLLLGLPPDFFPAIL